MIIPDSFERSLTSQFDGRMRIRYSNARDAYHVEQRVGRASIGFAAGEGDDPAIRLRDGYRLVCEVRRGDRMPCQNCNATLPVPVFGFAEVVCLRCARQVNRNYGTHVAGFFELGDRLLEHLRSIDPTHNHVRNEIAAMDLRNRRRAATAERDALAPGQAALFENYNKLVGIESFGYSGKTSSWVDAPASPGLPLAKDAA